MERDILSALKTWKFITLDVFFSRNIFRYIHNYLHTLKLNHGPINTQIRIFMDAIVVCLLETWDIISTTYIYLQYVCVFNLCKTQYISLKSTARRKKLVDYYYLFLSLLVINCIK